MDLDKWKRNIIKTLEQIASRKYQESAWFGKSSIVSSPEELLCTLFDDYQFEDFFIMSKKNMTESQRIIGELLLEKLNSFSEKIGDFPKPEEVIDHPEWQEIRELARKFIEEGDWSIEHL
jgi:hypothetical protein